MNNNFNNMDDLFNQLMGNMGGYIKVKDLNKMVFLLNLVVT